MVDVILQNWKKAQDAGAWLPCPRCGEFSMDEKATRNALSRRKDIYICNACGLDESFEDVPVNRGRRIPIHSWFAVRSMFPKEKEYFSIRVVHIEDIVLTRENIDDIMVSALEGGINYWCDDAEVPEERRVADWGHEQIARGGVLMIHDSEVDDVYELTLEKFLDGFKLWIEKGMDRYGAVKDGKVDCCEIDSSCADSIIQLALFGEILYA